MSPPLLNPSRFLSARKDAPFLSWAATQLSGGFLQGLPRQVSLPTSYIIFAPLQD